MCPPPKGSALPDKEEGKPQEFQFSGVYQGSTKEGKELFKTFVVPLLDKFTQGA